MAPFLLTPTQPANEKVRNRSLQIGWDVLKSQLPSDPYELMVDLVSMSKGVFPVDAGKAWKVLVRNFKGPGGPKGPGLVPVPVGPALKAPTSTSTINPAAPLRISKQVAKTAGGEPIYEQKPARTKQTKRKGKSEVPVDERVSVSDIPRRETEMPPTAELIKFAKEQGISEEFAKQFAKDSVKTFNQQRKFARLASQQRTPGQVDIKGDSDAGHYLAAKTESAQHLADEPGKRLHTPPTHGDTARPQARIENRLNKPEDHINLHIADSVGIHTTWANKLKAAWNVSNGKHVFNFKADLSLKGQEAMLNIPTSLSRSQAIKARDAILADPSNLSNNLSKHDMRDILIDNARNDLDFYTTD